MQSKSTKFKSKTRISITIMPFLNQMLEKIVEQSGESKSSLIEHAIENYIGDKLEEDAKALSKLKFDDLPSEEDWLAIQSEVKF